jgi:hypothetical protein
MVEGIAIQNAILQKGTPTAGAFLKRNDVGIVFFDLLIHPMLTGTNHIIPPDPLITDVSAAQI